MGCIRCREIRGKQMNNFLKDIVLRIRCYESSGGLEYFISFETQCENVIFGFVRLRLCNVKNDEFVKNIFPELIGCAMVRELHVYGQMIPVFERENETQSSSQHMGFGEQLMNAAQIVAVLNG